MHHNLFQRVDHHLVSVSTRRGSIGEKPRARGRAFRAISAVTANHGSGVPVSDNLIAAQASSLSSMYLLVGKMATWAMPNP